MKPWAILLIATLVSGCGQGDSTENHTQPNATANVSAPINNSAVTPVANTPPPSPSIAMAAAEPKPLVSRETSPPRSSAPDYRAIGAEPFWGVTLRGRTITLERPDQPPLRYTIRDESDDRAIRFVGDGFALTATEGPCSDGMSEAVWSDRVQIAFADGVLKGCGGQQQDMREAPF
ncbi:membrane-like protein [Sphingobium sp.]|uniref:membrane-like protein n=1 Tax=Sphingobium sp. TaxID=1912891 RepID=UPI003B3A395B